MKIKTSKLEGAALDWAVAQCEGYSLKDNGETIKLYKNSKFFWDWDIDNRSDSCAWAPTLHWEQGGPIIEREEIEINVVGEAVQNWCAIKWPWDTPGELGKTPLIAAMRCYVAYKLGNKVDVPEELL